MRAILLSLLVVLSITSCSKDQRTSRRIDGDWKATIFTGSNVQSFEEYKFTFSKDRKGEGTGVLIYKDGNFSEAYGLQYFIKNDRLTMIVDQDAIVFTIGEITRKKITLTDTYGYATILVKD